MSTSTFKKVFGAVAAAGLLVALAGCGSAPDAKPSGGASGGATDGFKPCMVSDEGGFDDKSFNQSGYEGLTRAADELGVKISKTESKTASDYAANLDGLVNDGCTLIISVGFMLSAPPAEPAPPPSRSVRCAGAGQSPGQCGRRAPCAVAAPAGRWRLPATA